MIISYKLSDKEQNDLYLKLPAPSADTPLFKHSDLVCVDLEYIDEDARPAVRFLFSLKGDSSSDEVCMWCHVLWNGAVTVYMTDIWPMDVMDEEFDKILTQVFKNSPLWVKLLKSRYDGA